MSRFSGKVVIVTGAASGLGRATALAFAAEGANVMALDVDNKGLEATEQQARGLCVKTGSTISSQRCDVSNSDACQQAVATTASSLGGIDILVNNAAIIEMNPSSKVTPDMWNRTIGVNLSGPFFLYQAAIAHVIERRGSIINIASVGAILPEAYVTPYVASKAALVHLTKSLAMEHIHDDVRINAIAPGAMATGMMDPGEDGTMPVLPEGVDMELVSRYMPLREAAKPEEVAELILYVASDSGKSFHGACLSIDGGVAVC